MYCRWSKLFGNVKSLFKKKWLEINSVKLKPKRFQLRVLDKKERPQVELNVNSIQVKESTNADLLALTVRV